MRSEELEAGQGQLTRLTLTHALSTLHKARAIPAKCNEITHLCHAFCTSIREDCGLHVRGVFCSSNERR